MIIGLEVHAELLTSSKIFCSCSTQFGGDPNNQCCPICTGMPGALPSLNQKAVELAVKAGLALHCSLSLYSEMARKNYIYPDLPKGYQISQADLPLCKKGYLEIETETGIKSIGITRIHLEEDAGKLIHSGDFTFCDYNRCGLPLIEIVSEPDLRSADEAVSYLKALRLILLYAGISDCRMEEGSFRCDVNLSVRKKGSTLLGTRTEMKNLNSFQFVKTAIEYEFHRQLEILRKGESILQETRRFDSRTGETYAMRLKENSADYRYFPEPDLPPILLSTDFIKECESALPVLPAVRRARYLNDLHLSPAEADSILARPEQANFFETALSFASVPRTLINLFVGEVFRLWDSSINNPLLTPKQLAAISDLLAEEQLNSAAAKKLICLLWENGGTAQEAADAHSLWQLSDPNLLQRIVEEVITVNPQSVEDYQKGKRNAFQSLIGCCMKKTNGRGNPRILTQLLEQALSSSKINR